MTRGACLAVATLASTAFAWGQTVADDIVRATRARVEAENDVAFQDGQFPTVIQGLRVSCELEPSDGDAWSNLVWMLGNVEDHGGAWAIAARFHRLNSTNPDSSYLLAEWLFRRRAFGQVPALLEPAVAATPPPHPNSFRYLAHAYDRLGFFEDSVRVWELLIKLNPDDAPAKANRDRVRAKLSPGQ